MKSGNEIINPYKMVLYGITSFLTAKYTAYKL
jgi:hypothetical protein